MSAAMQSYARHVLARQALVCLAAYLGATALAPSALMLRSESATRIFVTSFVVTVLGVSLTLGWSAMRLRARRFSLRALALGSTAIAPEDIAELANLPIGLTARYVISGALASALLLVPGITPADLDTARAVSLALLTFTLVSASAVVHYVVVRAATARIIEVGPLEPITSWIEEHAVQLWPRRLLMRRILFATVAPVALVGVGTVLVAHAHLRALREDERTSTATMLAQAALQPAPGAVRQAGRDEAKGAASPHGFVARIEEGSTALPGPPERVSTGELVVAVPLDDGRAVVRYSAEIGGDVVTSGVVLAALAVLLAALLGRAFGQMLSRDLELAAQDIGKLGTERVLRGGTALGGRARFGSVAALGRAIEALAERFRTFAAAQERALLARERAQRTKDLLFASVSHDLKSPLNAILGLAELVRGESLEPAQRESLDMVVSRGRELLALIETILDAARVEAGELRLLRQPLPADLAIRMAVDKARDLVVRSDVELLVEIAPDLPALDLDPAYGPRALGVLVAHAMEIGSSPKSRVIHVRAALADGASGGTIPPAGPGASRPPSSRPPVSSPPPPLLVVERGAAAAAAGARTPRAVVSELPPAPLARIDIEFSKRDNRASLLEKLFRGSSTSEGRGMMLQLSLARAIVELHRGRVAVGRGPQGTALVTVWLPLALGAPPSAADGDAPA
ncbi:MAG: HAMP domain-containing histidine kinase [Polyangiaceae bacterium]|nr:HAMP domain-containing histidine kinase [Polyangiaceae bacterium]